MNNMKENDYMIRRISALKKIAPYFADPGAYPIPKLSLDEVSALLFEEGKEPSRRKLADAEKSALLKMKTNFARLGINSVNDVIAVR